MRPEHAIIPLEGAAGARVRVAHIAGYLQLKTSADAEALNGGLFGGGMDSQIQRKGETVDVQLCSPQKQGLLS